MIFGTAKRLFTLAVLAFATMGFLAVPLGEKSGFEHVRDFFTSDEAQAAGEHLEETFDALESKWKENEEQRRLKEQSSDQSPAQQIVRRREGRAR